MQRPEEPSTIPIESQSLHLPLIKYLPYTQDVQAEFPEALHV
jgi:hypothetical protein